MVSNATIMEAHRDPNTSSNYDYFVISNTIANLEIDLNRNIIRGHVILTLISSTDAATDKLILDTSYLGAKSVTLDEREPRKRELLPRQLNGSALKIHLQAGVKKGESVIVIVS